MKAMGKDELNGDSVTADASVDKLATWYYYQNPGSGEVSSNPRSVQQLVKLLVPVRDGMAPILSAQTLCLPVSMQNVDEASTKSQASSSEASSQPSFGEWKPASEWDILKEASCIQWHISDSSASNEEEKMRGPMHCRSVLEAIEKSHSVNEGRAAKLLFYAPSITNNEWLPLDKLPNLQLVMEVLKVPKDNPVKSLDRTTQQGEAEISPADRPEVQDELEAFLSETQESVHRSSTDNDANEDHAYESDGGTRYVKDPLTGNWIHEALAPKEDPAPSKSGTKNGGAAAAIPTKSNPKKSKKAKFSKRNARQWIYVSGLPTTKSKPRVTVQDLQKFFSKAGMLDLDPETMQPKIKLYQNDDGSLKGDASLCYARPESVDLALQILDESPWDEEHTLKVERAKFEAKTTATGAADEEAAERAKKRKRTISQAQRKVARLALLQAQDDGFGDRLAGGRKGLHIIVVKHMLDGIPERHWEETIQKHTQELDDNPELEKVTCISKTRVVLLKFVEPSAASQAVEVWHGQPNESGSATIEAFYWDGVTNYTHQEDDPAKDEKRHEDFGKWLEAQEETQLPPELRLQVAED